MSKELVTQLNDEVYMFVEARAKSLWVDVKTFDFLMLAKECNGQYYTTSIKGKSIKEFYEDCNSGEHFAFYDLLCTAMVWYRSIVLSLVTTLVTQKRDAFTDEEVGAILGIISKMAKQLDNVQDGRLSKIQDSVWIDTASSSEIKTLVLKFIEALKN